MKVLLINPPQKQYIPITGFSVYHPVSLIMLGTVIQDLCDVKILDCLVEDYTINWQKDSAVFGMPFEQIEKQVTDYDPDIIGITVPITIQSQLAIELSVRLKKLNPDYLLIFGGAHATIDHENILKQEVCDYIVLQEGEETFRQVVEHFKKGVSLKDIPGIAYLESGEIKSSTRPLLDDLDKLPLPDYSLVDMGKYQNNPYLYRNNSKKPENSLALFTSRGCPYKCTFCSCKISVGQKYRYHSHRYVINHIKHLIDQYSITSFHFMDDNLSLAKKRFHDFLDTIIAENITIQWDTPNGIRADALDFDLLQKMKQAGCYDVSIPVESGNQNVLNRIIKKKSDLKKVSRIIKWCYELDIKTTSYYIIGFPGETVETMKETIQFALFHYKEYNSIPLLFPATPLFGTELYEESLKKGYVSNKLTALDFAKQRVLLKNTLIRTPEFTPETITSLFTYFENEKFKILIEGEGKMGGSDNHKKNKEHKHRETVHITGEISGQTGGIEPSCEITAARGEKSASSFSVERTNPIEYDGYSSCTVHLDNFVKQEIIDALSTFPIQKVIKVDVCYTQNEHSNYDFPPLPGIKIIIQLEKSNPEDHPAFEKLSGWESYIEYADTWTTLAFRKASIDYNISETLSSAHINTIRIIPNPGNKDRPVDKGTYHFKNLRVESI